MTLGSSYKKRYSYSGNLRFNYNKSKLGDFENPSISNDFSLSWSHTPDSRGKSSRFSSSVNFQTNSYNQNKNLVYSNFNESINAQFNSNISYSKTFNGPFNLSANLRHSQNVQTKIVNLTLPDVSYNMSRIYPFKNLGKLAILPYILSPFKEKPPLNKFLKNEPPGNTFNLSTIVSKFKIAKKACP